MIGIQDIAYYICETRENNLNKTFNGIVVDEEFVKNKIGIEQVSRKKDDEKLFPYIKKAVKAEYLARGAEGLTSRNEGSMSSSFEDIIDKLRNNIIKSGLRRMK